MTILNRLLAVILGAGLLLALPSVHPAHASAIKDVAAAYIAELNVLFFFGGWDERTPIIASAGFINLTAPFSVDSPPITSIPSIPTLTSRLVPLVVKNAIGDSFDIIVSGGITPYQSGAFVPGTTAWTYSVIKDVASNGGGNGAQQQPSIRVTVNGGRNSEGLPFGPAFQYAATTAEGVFGNAHAFGGRTFPTPFFNQLKVIDRFGAYNTVAFNNNSAPAPRADASLVRVNSTHLILAGGDGNGTRYNDIWLFNMPQTNWIRYPHTFIQPHAFGGFAIYTAPSSNRYVILIGRESPFIEYFNLSANGPPQAADATGQGPSSLEQPTAVMIGDQMVIVGGFTKPGDPDQRFFRVLKVRESDGSKLSFEWQNSFTPIAKANNGAGSPPPPGSPGISGGNGGGEGEKKPSWVLPLIISGSALAVILAIAVAFFLFRRRRSQQASAVKSHERDPNLVDGDSAVSFKQPLVVSTSASSNMTTDHPAPRSAPAPTADISAYPLAPPHPVSSTHDSALLSKSTMPDGFVPHQPIHRASADVFTAHAPIPTPAPTAHPVSPVNRHASLHSSSSVNVVMQVGRDEEDEVFYLPQPPMQQMQKSPDVHQVQSPFETLLLPTATAQAVDGEAVALAQVDQRTAGMAEAAPQHPTMGTLYLPNATRKRVERVGANE